MNVSIAKPANFSRLMLFFFGLAFAVFAWGLQYKLSLYDPPQAVSHQMPEAKLLSKEEQPSQSTSPLLEAIKFAKPLRMVISSIFLLISLALNLLHAPALVERKWDVETPWRLRCFASLNAFFFRPPPVLP